MKNDKLTWAFSLLITALLTLSALNCVPFDKATVEESLESYYAEHPKLLDNLRVACAKERSFSFLTGLLNLVNVADYVGNHRSKSINSLKIRNTSLNGIEDAVVAE